MSINFCDFSPCSALPPLHGKPHLPFLVCETLLFCLLFKCGLHAASAVRPSKPLSGEVGPFASTFLLHVSQPGVRTLDLSLLILTC